VETTAAAGGGTYSPEQITALGFTPEQIARYEARRQAPKQAPRPRPALTPQTQALRAPVRDDLRPRQALLSTKTAPRAAAATIKTAAKIAAPRSATTCRRQRARINGLRNWIANTHWQGRTAGTDRKVAIAFLIEAEHRAGGRSRLVLDLRRWSRTAGVSTNTLVAALKRLKRRDWPVLRVAAGGWISDKHEHKAIGSVWLIRKCNDRAAPSAVAQVKRLVESLTTTTTDTKTGEEIRLLGADEWRHRGYGGNGAAVAAALLSDEWRSTADVAYLANVSNRATRRQLDKLATAGVAVCEIRGRAKYWRRGATAPAATERVRTKTAGRSLKQYRDDLERRLGWYAEQADRDRISAEKRQRESQRDESKQRAAALDGSLRSAACWRPRRGAQRR